MQVFRTLEELRPGGQLSQPVLTIGTFDGVHLGHQSILQRLKVAALEHGGQSVVMTFHPHPRRVLFPEEDSLRLLNSLDEKLARLEQMGMDAVIVVPFTREFASQTSEEFIEQVLVQQVGIRHIAVGYDHRFGRDRGGGLADLARLGAKHGFTVEEIPALLVDQANVSSTRIRKELAAGHVEMAARYLGAPYRLLGTVVHGDKIGRTLGYPTANLQVDDPDKLIPAIGIYAVWVDTPAQGRHMGMLNIGYRPTVGGKDLRVEVNLLDFDGDLYGQQLGVDFIAFLRPDAHFNGLDELKAALARDAENTRTSLGNG
jgi:riboflavin kinase/FMN adenylyltransferase